MEGESLEILLVEDDEGDIAIARELLSGGFDPAPAVLVRRSLSDATDELIDASFDVVVLDLGLPDSTGLSTLERVRDVAPEIPVVVLTARADVELGRKAIARGAEDYLVKGELSGALLSRSIRYGLERAEIRRSMRESRESFRAIVETVSDAVLVLSGDEIQYVSPSVRKILGYVPSEPTRQDFLDLLHPADRADVARALKAIDRAPGAHVSVECRLRHLGGDWRQLELTLRNLRSDAAIQGVVVSLKDITDRIRAERALGAARERYRTVVENALSGFYILEDGRWSYVNPRLAEILGRSRAELLGSDPLDVVDADDRPLLAEMLARHERGEGESERFTVSGTRGDGGRFRVEIQGCRARIDGTPAVMGTVRDLTERDELRTRLGRAQRLEAVGRLAGSIAHDFNNILTTIIGHVDVATEQLDEGSPASSDLAEVRRSARKGASLIRQLLAYTRRQAPRPELVHVNQALASVSRMLDRLMDEDIELQRRASDFDELVRIDPGQLEQVVVNLVINARDAIDGGGTITLSTASRELTAEEVAAVPFPMPPGSYVELTVGDDGEGMSEKALAEVFEPISGTAGEGGGGGLSLRTAYDVVKECGGFIHAESEEGVGTTLRVFLPAVEASAGEEQLTGPPGTQDPAVATARRDGRRDGRILLVEDDDAVRRTTARSLQTWGYVVHGASDGPNALALLEEGLDVELVLTDMVMPEMGGQEFARRARELVPDAEILFMSGYARERSEGEEPISDERHFIAKPFSPLELAAKVEGLLRGRRSAGGLPREAGEAG